MKTPIIAAAVLLFSLPAVAQLRINEFSATNSDRLLVRETGQYPRVGSSVSWQSADFADPHWRSGNGPFGFGSLAGVDVGTDLSADMQGRTPGLYLRKTFSVSSAEASSGSMLQLAVRYNDGFIAFLNGVEIARRNMGFPGMFAYRDQPSYASHSSTTLETIDLGAANSLLSSSGNVLAIQVHNQSAGSGDLLMAADLNLVGGATIVDGTSAWKYFPGLAEPSGGLADLGQLLGGIEEAPDVHWATLAFNDSTWTSAVGPVGFDVSSPPDYLLGVDLTTEMRNITPSVYVRSVFNVSQAEADSSFPLSLEVDFDDGLIVYLNGNEVYRGNVGTVGVFTPHDTPANGNHPATGDGGGNPERAETFTLAAAKDLLFPGTNVIGIQIHNDGVGSSDLIGKATLRTTGASPRAISSPGDAVKYFVGVSEPDAVIDDDTEDDIGEIEDPPDSENDWIEIRNTGSAGVSLDGWSLSDDAGEPRKWDFPAGAEIPANGYYLVIASGFDLTPAANGTSYPHASFQLSASGERIILTRPDGGVEDELAADFPPQNWRYTYGRQADGTFGYLALGTPGAMNVGDALGPAPSPPVFGVDGGFHPSALTVVLTSSTPGSTIVYTTDGADPLDGVPYSGPIVVNDNTVIRARALLAGAIPSAIVTRTYLINEGPAYQGLPAMCLTGDPVKTFYGPNATGGPANGEGIFAISSSPEFSHTEARGRAYEKIGSMEYLPLTGEPLRTELGLRIAGSNHTRGQYTITDPMDQPFTSNSNTSTKFQKPSMNIFFRPEFGERPLNYPFFGSNSVTEFESLRVRAGKNDWYNPFIRDELMRRLFINTGQVGSYGAIHTLWINGVYKGFYNTAERVREGFLQAHYNSNESWDVQQVNSFASGDPTNWNKMINYLRTADLTTNEGYAGVHDYLDVDNYIDYILVNAYAAMGDWPHNNWIAARERTSLGRWRFYMWDAEGSFGFAERNSSTNMFTEHLTLPSSRYPTANATTTTNQYVQAIYTLLKASPEFRLRIADRAQKHLYNGGALVTSEISEEYNELKDEISPIMLEALGVTFRTDWYTNWIANNKRFNELISQLGGEGAWPATKAPDLNQHGGEISQGFQLALSNPNGGGTIYFTTNGSDPRAPGGAVAGMAYDVPVTLGGDTRVRARVLQSGNWSPEIDVEFSLPFADPTFLPLASADWTADGNWSSAPAPYPDGAGVATVVPGVPGADRNCDLRAPVTVGRIHFDLADSVNRSRVRDRSSGNSLTFSNPGAPAEILVTGSGKGYAEIDVEEGSVLDSDLVIDVRHSKGDSDHGALRLRSGWNGVGGLTKKGSGIATLSGSGKNYAGPTVIERGVLQLTEPASPVASASLAVLPGGQLRLTSGNTPGDPPRNHVFGGTLSLSGEGRGGEIADGEGNGKLGALRYEPGGENNHAVISSSVELSAPAEIHVVGPTNRLELSQPLDGIHALTKSGGGALVLGGDQSGLDFPIRVAAGTLEIRGGLGSPIDLAPTATLTGHGSTGAITGEGAIVLNQTLLQAPASNASRYSFEFGADGVPNLGNPASVSNSTVMLDTTPAGILALDFYLTGSALVPDAVSLGGLVVPFTSDLGSAISSASVRVFSPDPSGAHEFDGQLWSPLPGFSLTSIAYQLGAPAPFDRIRILELRNGAGPPASFGDWQSAMFDPAGLADPAVSGANANPFGDGVPNLLRYAFGVPVGSPAMDYLPEIHADAASIHLRFPFGSGRDDLVVIVESSDELGDWSDAFVLFDSSLDFPPAPDESGRISISDPRPPGSHRFYRVRAALK